MFHHRILHGVAALALGLLLPAASFAADPDFDSVVWQRLGCDSPDLIVEDSPSAASFAGDQEHPPAFYAVDDDYLYFRYRMDSNPSGSGGFSQNAWTALMQVPSGNRFQYQYQLSLNGKDDTIEIWRNTNASDIDFSPLFRDDSEQPLSSVPFGSLARAVSAGTSFGGEPDWFVDFAFPVSALVANGVVSGATELAQSLFFPATSTNPNTYNKSRLNCPFQPFTTLAIEKSVAPEMAPANAVTPVTYTITVQNAAGTAAGVVVEDIPLPAYLSDVAVEVTSDDPAATHVVESVNPLRVKVPVLAATKHVTVAITAEAAPGCGSANFVNTATVGATNALERTASATLAVQKANGDELCDAKDNDCDGLVDEGANLCDDGNACTTDSCGGATGCSHEQIAGCVPCATAADCEDGNACTVDTCTSGVCAPAPVPGCEPCATAGDCAGDGNACTVETCTDGVCSRPVTAGCEPCASATDCASDGNACTVETCTDGVCSRPVTAGCEPCATAGDCAGDGNACTVETCTDGVCGRPATAGCEPCATPSDCAGDDNACTIETCTSSVCGALLLEGCEPCATASDCAGDGNACTEETCIGSVCGALLIEGCTPCTAAADCADNDPCTTETCSAGACGSVPASSCEGCTTDAQCDDASPCTSDVCGADGSCELTTIAGCRPCTTAGDCDDADPCTTDVCTAGACDARPTDSCDVEACADGADNDRDGDVDCSDRDCTGDPACTVEVCDDCQDNDGDGLVDYDDSDCCAATHALALRRMSMKLKPGTAGNRLRLRGKYVTATPASVDPARDGVTLQIADGDGQVYCHDIPVRTRKRLLKRGVFKLRDRKGTSAAGIRSARIKIRKDGRVVFRIRGRKMQFRTPTGSGVRVTLRVGGQCTQAVAPLRTRQRQSSTRMMFP